jgi:hypothetical protein
VGGRYSFEKRNFSREHYQETQRYYPSGLSLVGVSVPLPGIAYGERRKVADDIYQKSSDRFWTPRYVIDYKLLKNLMFYTSAAKGFKNGGFSTATENKDLILFYPEVSWIADVDLSILGRPPAAFAEYERRVRAEYHRLAEPIYRAGRASILALLLARKPLYRSDHFRERYESAARRNLEGSLERLKAGAGSE